ncbi:unnamed protein product [Colias eurytheme]|nr:unnamed protein product [Colias eurytheme]
MRAWLAYLDYYFENPVPFLFPLWPRSRQCSVSFTAREKLKLCCYRWLNYFNSLHKGISNIVLTHIIHDVRRQGGTGATRQAGGAG